MIPGTRNLAGLAMTLSCRIGLKKDDAEAIKNVYAVLIEINELMSDTIPNDMETYEWQKYVGMVLAQMATAKINKECCHLQGIKHITIAVETLKQSPEAADLLAQVVLGKLYE